MIIPGRTIHKRTRILEHNFLGMFGQGPMKFKAFNFFQELFKDSVIGLCEPSDINPKLNIFYKPLHFEDYDFIDSNDIKLSNPVIVCGTGQFTPMRYLLHEVCHILELDKEEFYRLTLPNLGMGINKKYIKNPYKTAFDREAKTIAIQFALCKYLEVEDSGISMDAALNTLTKLETTKPSQVSEIYDKSKNISIDSLLENWQQKNEYILHNWKGLGKEILF